jgi:type II secretory pathway component PulF
MSAVGDRAGTLPEVLEHLGNFYHAQHRLRHQFLRQITLPVLQLIAAVFVIAALIFILGFIADLQGSKPIDPLGLGLTGGRGALLFLAGFWGGVALLAVAFVALSRFAEGRAAVDAFLLRLPLVGPCLRTLALARLCLGLHATLETGMPLRDALRLAFEGTGNAAFAHCNAAVWNAIQDGCDLAAALTRCPWLTEDFLAVVAVAEESGRIPEVLARQGKRYEEQAADALAVLARLAGFAVWVFVAALIILAILRLLSTTYLAALEGAMK